MDTAIANPPRRRRSDLSVVRVPVQVRIATISRDEVERRAYQRFLERGRADGADLDDWLEAERELLASRLIDV